MIAVAVLRVASIQRTQKRLAFNDCTIVLFTLKLRNASVFVNSVAFVLLLVSRVPTVTVLVVKIYWATNIIICET